MPIYRKVNKNFFKKWNQDMAYILGFMYADGNITVTKRNTHFFAIYTADKDLLRAMLVCMKSDHSLSTRTSITGSHYRVQIGCKEMFDDLGKIGLSPNKSKRIRFPKVPKQFLSSFIRGFFDGDGNVWSGLIHKDRKMQCLTLQVCFTSASALFLRDLQKNLISLGCGFGSLRKIGNYGRLQYSQKDALQIAKIMYNGPHKLFLKRKKLVFERFIRRCSSIG